MTLLSYANHEPCRQAPASLFRQDVLPPALPAPDHASVALREAERVIKSQESRIRELEALAQTDELTGLLNRRGLMAALNRELARTRRTEKNEGLLVLLDIDDFAAINELYGHDAGNSYLQTMGSVLINEIRTTDFAARIDGDGFALLLPQIGMKAAGKRLAELEKVVNSRIMHSRKHAIPLRASFGFAILSETETPASLLLSADKKLHVSKARRKMGMKS